MTTANPFAPPPERTAAEEAVSGGGADGRIDHVIAALLPRVLPQPDWQFAVHPEPPDDRQFDLAELIGWACRAAGVPGANRLPGRHDELLRYCQSQRTIIDRDTALATKGALLFGANTVGVSLGLSHRVLVYGERAGLVIDSGMRAWTTGALIPGARGYR